MGRRRGDEVRKMSPNPKSTIPNNPRQLSSSAV